MLTAVVVIFLIGALFGIAIVLLSAEHFSAAGRRIDADVAFMRAMPAGVERLDQ